MIKFLHAADLHLGSPFAALPPAAARQRRAELLETATEIVELCNSSGCQLLLLAGDICETAEAARALARLLAACSAEVVIAPGNHDPYGPNGPYASVAWPENVSIFDDTEMARLRFEDLKCDVYGAAFLEETAPALMEGFEVLDHKVVNLMVLHGDPEQPSSPYNPISQAQIEASGLDYLALGHIHSYSGPRVAGGVSYAWPGVPAGRGFDETGVKGVILGQAGRGKPVELEFVPLHARRYETIAIPAGTDPAAAIRAVLPADARRDIYRITLTGPSVPLDVRALASSLRDVFYQVTLRDETTQLTALWEGMEQDNLRGLFLRQLHARWEQAADEQTRKTCELAAQFGLAALEGKEAPAR